MNTSAAGVDQWRATTGDGPTTATTTSSSPASSIVRRNVGSVSIRPLRGSTKVLSCHSQPGLVLLRAAVVVDREQHGVGVAGGGTEPDRRTAAVGADLDEGCARDGGPGVTRGPVQGVALVGRHEPDGVERRLPKPAVHGSGLYARLVRMTAALVDDLVTLLDLEPIEVNIFRGRVARREPPAGVRRPGRRPGAGRGGPHRRRADRAGALAARLLPAPGRPDGADPLRGRPHPRRPQLHHAPGRRASSTARRSSTCRPASTIPSPGSTTSSPMPPTCPIPRRCPTSRSGMAPYRDAARRLVRPAPPDRHPLRRPAIRSQPQRDAPAESQRVWMRADGALPDDPGAARVRRHLRQRHDAARHHRAARSAWRGTRPGMQMASLDHAMWFHRPFRADEWLLYDQHAVSHGRRAGLAGGAIFTRDGRARRERGAGGPDPRSLRESRVIDPPCSRRDGRHATADDGRVLDDDVGISGGPP